MAYRLSRRAEKDLQSIIRYSLDAWGRSATDAYMATIESRFLWLAQNPRAGRDRPEISKTARSFPEGRHVIFYRINGKAVYISAVLHQSMDVSGHLR
jgi:toxin ParE1/3/4